MSILGPRPHLSGGRAPIAQHQDFYGARSELETNILDHLIPNPIADPSPARTLSLYLIKIARLGGYLARAKDPPPGNIVMWRGLSRLNDIPLGAHWPAPD